MGDETRTRGLGDSGTRGRGDSGTRGLGDSGTRGLGDRSRGGMFLENSPLSLVSHSTRPLQQVPVEKLFQLIPIDWEN
ncbi:hypothetical protein MiSe_23700 [Microseira wollei NIES-4236]|uniref:Transposase n=1 Tax=Microseira wollei NIES-4236 TaxID=2530354 RepID=A0AAV3XAH8_9CYAN|nr:hypothetical protein MiSe_23700 [Microseira wollei NIES-4236]